MNARGTDEHPTANKEQPMANETTETESDRPGEIPEHTIARRRLGIRIAEQIKFRFIGFDRRGDHLPTHTFDVDAIGKTIAMFIPATRAEEAADQDAIMAKLNEPPMPKGRNILDGLREALGIEGGTIREIIDAATDRINADSRPKS
jgi:hypothetical protein